MLKFGPLQYDQWHGLHGNECAYVTPTSDDRRQYDPFHVITPTDGWKDDDSVSSSTLVVAAAGRLLALRTQWEGCDDRTVVVES